MYRAKVAFVQTHANVEFADIQVIIAWEKLCTVHGTTKNTEIERYIRMRTKTNLSKK
jgi:hypothetical protein